MKITIDKIKDIVKDIISDDEWVNDSSSRHEHNGVKNGLNQLVEHLEETTKRTLREQYKELEDRTNQLIQAYDKGNQIGLFRITENACPTDHLETVIKDYFRALKDTTELNADLGLFIWGIERVYVDYEVNIGS